MCHLATATDLDHPEAVAVRTAGRLAMITDVDLPGAIVLAVKITAAVTAIAAPVASEAASTMTNDAMVAPPLAEEALPLTTTHRREELEAGTTTLTDATTAPLPTRTSTGADALMTDHRGNFLPERVAGMDLAMVVIRAMTTAEVEVATGKLSPTLPSLGAIPYFI